MKEYCGVSGWNPKAIKKFEQIHQILQATYWYRKYEDYSQILRKEWDIQIGKKIPIRDLLSMFKNAIVTINGQLVKQFLAFGEFRNSYDKIAKTTSDLFRDLILEYFSNPSMMGTKDAIKELAAMVKRTFNKEKFEESTYWLNNLEDIKIKSIIDFWKDPFRRLKREIVKITNFQEKYINSISWLQKCDIMSQTRFDGYLPRWKSEENRKKYQEKIEREPVQPTKDQVWQISTALTNSLLNEEIPKNIFSINSENDEIKRLIAEDSDIDIKSTASKDNKVYDGGRLQDAKELLELLKSNDAYIKEYDLVTWKVTKQIKVIELLKLDNFP